MQYGPLSDPSSPDASSNPAAADAVLGRLPFFALPCLGLFGAFLTVEAVPFFLLAWLQDAVEAPGSDVSVDGSAAGDDFHDADAASKAGFRGKLARYSASSVWRADS